MLATREAFDPYWTLSGLPKGAIAVATLVAGYRQGWVVSNLPVAADVVITYEGRRYGTLALLLSALVALLSVLVALGRQVVRIRGRSSEVHLIADAAWQAALQANGGSISGALLEQLKDSQEPPQRWPS